MGFNFGHLVETRLSLRIAVIANTATSLEEGAGWFVPLLSAVTVRSTTVIGATLPLTVAPAKDGCPPHPAVRTAAADIGFAPDSGRSDAYGSRSQVDPNRSFASARRNAGPCPDPVIAQLVRARR
jgi:hypothetical protein